MKCSYCDNEVDFVLIWERSFFGVCLEHLKWYCQFLSHSKPYIIPLEYVDEGLGSQFFPVPYVRFGDKKFVFGKTEEEFKNWVKETNQLVEFNIE